MILLKNNQSFDIEDIKENLPVNYRAITSEKLDYKNSNRYASFESYKSGSSECFQFYRSITRIVYYSNDDF